jgi:Transposase and inactivated derivatives
MLDAIFYLVVGGIAWAAMPHDFPPYKTVYGIFRRWTTAGVWVQIHDALRDLVRVYEGRDPQPTAAIIDSQSLRGADTVPAATRGYDSGNHAGGWLCRVRRCGSLLSQARPGAAGERPGITTGSPGRRVAGRAGGTGLVLLPAVRCGAGRGGFLEREVGVQVDLRRFGPGVAEPQRDR